MQNIDIDELERCIVSWDVNGLSEFFSNIGMPISERDVNHQTDKLGEAIASLCKQIERDEALLSKFKESRVLIHEINLFSKDTLVFFINNREEYKLDSGEICILAIHTKDPNLIKEILKNRKKYGNVSPEQLCNLAYEAKDEVLFRTFIRKGNEYGITINVLEYLAMQKGANFVRCIIKNRNECGFTNEDVCVLAGKTMDVAFLEELIENYKKYNFDAGDVHYLISCIITSRKKIEDKVFAMKLVKKREEYFLTQDEVLQLIGATRDKEFILKVIEEREEYGIEKTHHIYMLAEATQDKEFIKEIIRKKEKYKLNDDQIFEIAMLTRDREILTELLVQYSKHGFNSWQVVEILKILEDGKLARKLASICAKERKRQGIGLPECMTFGIEIEAEVMNRKVTREANHSANLNRYSRFIIVPDRYKEGELISGKMFYEMSDDWEIKYEASIGRGNEFTSPKLSSNENSRDAIYEMCNNLDYLRYYSSNQCGGHIHIGADYLKSAQSYKNLLELWGNCEKILFIISNRKGELPRDGIEIYATPMSGKFEKAINGGKVDLRNEEDLETICEKIKKIQKVRCSSINFLNIGNKSKNTIEFRLSNGTLDPDIWIQNVNLFGGIVRVSEELSLIQKKPREERTSKEQLKLDLFERTKEDGVDDRELLECLLRLVIERNQRYIYRERYDVNSRLLQEGHHDVAETILRRLAKGKIIITPREIEKKAFTGNEPITGLEYFEVSQHISEEMAELDRSGNQLQQE